MLFAFGPGSTAIAGATSPSRFYAMEGDLVGLSSGRQMRFGTDTAPTGRQWQVGYGPVRMLAGRDIVGSGSPLGSVNSYSGTIPYTYTDNLFLHGDARDVSTVRAGRDILYGNFTVGGPGTLEISAGRNILMEGQAAVVSLYPSWPATPGPAPASSCKRAWARPARTTPASSSATWTAAESPIRPARLPTRACRSRPTKPNCCCG
ncbi:hypothetical protein WJ972_31985 [Achromobacter insuavis]